MNKMMIIEVPLSILLGGIFLTSAIPKLSHPKGFVLTVLDYRVIPFFLGRLYGWLIPPLEYFLALLLLSGTAIRLAAIAMSLLLLSFIVAVGINIARGRDLDCSCFGTMKRRRIGWSLLLQDGILLGASIVLARFASTWADTEPWSVFRLFNLISSKSLLPFLLCAGVVGATVSIRIVLFQREVVST